MKTLNIAVLSTLLFCIPFASQADYEMVDIGSINQSDHLIPVEINENGTIVGRYRVAQTHVNAKETKRGPSGVMRGFIWKNGNFTDIGPDPDPENPQSVNDIFLNDKGDVACTIGARPYIWTQGKLSPLDILDIIEDKYKNSMALDITNTGKVACLFYDKPKNTDLYIVEPQVLVTKHTGQSSPEETNDSFLQIGTIDQSKNSVLDIIVTESGNVLITTNYMPRSLRSDINPNSDYKPYMSYVYTDGVLQEVGLLEGYYDCKASDINETGQIAGTCYEKDIDVAGIGIRPKSAAFIREGNTIRNLAPGLKDSAKASCINKDGIVAGQITDDYARTTAAIWHEGKMTRLGAPKGFEHSWAVDINDKGRVVGYVASQNLAETRAIVWQDGEPYLLPTPDGYDSEALEINQKGLVLGKVFQKGDKKSTRTVFWKPKGRAELK